MSGVHDFVGEKYLLSVESGSYFANLALGPNPIHGVIERYAFEVPLQPESPARPLRPTPISLFILSCQKGFRRGTALPTASLCVAPPPPPNGKTTKVGNGGQKGDFRNAIRHHHKRDGETFHNYWQKHSFGLTRHSGFGFRRTAQFLTSSASDEL